ncbi:MAG TPA: hypothetical protein ACFCUY_06505 [Xenococcaceae cyanobacterium]|jgi:hypothetical protein
MVSLSVNSFSKVITSFLISCGCLISITNLQHSQVEKIKSSGNNSDYFKEHLQEKMQLEVLTKAPAFGFDNIFANLTILKFFQYFGDGDARKATDYSLSSSYLEAIIDKDPQFVQSYFVISPASSMFGGTPTKTVELMEKGLEYLSPDIPKSYFVWIYKGIDEILYLGDLKKAQQSYEKAAEWAKIVGDEKTAQSALDTAQFLATNPDARQAQVGAWFMIWTNNEDEQIRQLAQRKIEELGGTLEIYPDGRVVAKPPKPTNS